MALVAGVAVAAVEASPGLAAAAAFVNVGISLGIGTALSHLEQAMGNNSAAQTPRKQDEILYTTSIRSLPVPILYGRGRLNGNMIALGNFIRIATLPTGSFLKIEKGVVSLGEGPFQLGGNFKIDGQSPKQQSIIDNKPVSIYNLTMLAGTNSETLPALVSDPTNGFNSAILVPWRRTAKLLIDAPVGPTPRMASVSGDFVGPDLTIRRTATTTETGSGDVPIRAGYDGYSQSFYYTLSASTATSSPFGLVKIGRESAVREHTPPPAAMGASATRGWYLGRHDIVVMQDPSDSTKFWDGYWGITNTSVDWRSFHPSPGGNYGNTILAEHLDELHGVLHTLHDDGTTRYVMQWTLLTGRVTRVNVDIPSETFAAMLFSPDFDAYITIGNTSWRLIDAESGKTTYSTTILPAVGTPIGLCVSGQRVGAVSTDGVTYWDPQRGTFSIPLGTNTIGSAIECFGGTTSVTQNSWTGHVTLAKVDSAQPLLVNFIPSIFENIADTGAMGSPMPTPNVDPPQTQTEANTAAGWVDFSATPTVRFVRDWSWRTYNGSSLTALEGASSLAAAMWATLADELNLDSERWGAALNNKYLDLSSFEHVHAICVGQLMSTDPVTFVTFYSEKHKFDFVADSETTVSQLFVGEMLAACNGFYTMLSGKLHVGIHRSGMIPVWHFDENTIADGSAKMVILGRGNSVNRVRVQYTAAYLLDYRKDFAEANDEWDQSTRGRVQSQTLSLNGIARFVHADYLAKTILDQVLTSRKQVTFGTHYLARLLSPGDGIEISHKALGIKRERYRIADISENEDGTIKIAAQQAPVQKDSLKSVSGSPPPPAGRDPGGPDTICKCDTIATRTDDDTIIRWWNSGSTYPAGDYAVIYRGGVFEKEEGGPWYVGGFDIVTIVTGTVTVVTDAPGDPRGYADPTDAQTENNGASTTATLSSGGPLGLRAKVNGVQPISGAPLFELCAPQQGTCVPTAPPGSGGGACWVPWYSTYDCDTATFSTPTAGTPVCVTGTLSTVWMLVSGSGGTSCLYRKYLKSTTTCAVDGDCSAATTSTPSAPTDSSACVCSLPPSCDIGFLETLPGTYSAAISYTGPLCSSCVPASVPLVFIPTGTPPGGCSGIGGSPMWYWCVSPSGCNVGDIDQLTLLCTGIDLGTGLPIWQVNGHIACPSAYIPIPSTSLISADPRGVYNTGLQGAGIGTVIVTIS